MVGLLISIKDPYAWAASMLKFSGYNRPEIYAQRTEQEWDVHLKNHCERYNQRYKCWIQMAHNYKGATSIITYEELLVSPGSCLEKLGQKHKVEIQFNEEFLTKSSINPCVWDYDEPCTLDQKFEREYYTNGHYYEKLTGRKKEIVSQTIDWSLFSEVGYYK